MPSVMGLLEERERAARQRVEALQAELRQAEAVLERFVIAREAVGEVLAEPSGGEELLPAEEALAPPAVVPVWRAGRESSVLAQDYRRIMDILAGRTGPVTCRQLAVELGLEPVRSRVEGVRSKVKRLSARGWLAEVGPGLFTVPAGRACGS